MGKLTSSFARRMISRLLTISPDVRRYTADLVARAAEDIAYRRLIERGFRPAGIIDVGAYEGNWTRLVQRIFGPVPTLMVEAQDGKRPILDRVLTEHPATRLAMGALDEVGGREMTFFEMGTGSSLLPETSNVARTARTVTTRTLDEVVAEQLSVDGPLFLKIDVQGAELKVLRGGTATLARCELVQLEVALLQYNEGAPLLPEVVAFMAERDFLPIEVSGYSRPGKELVQIDLIFARKTSALRPERFTF